MTLLDRLRGVLAPWRTVDTLRAENERLARLADTDPLTGLLNRRGLAARVSGLRTDWCGLFVDLDDFGRVNEQLGYTMGDAVLRATVVRLAHALGPGAWLGRVGGDEFLAVLPETPLGVAAQLAEHTRAAVTAVDIPGIGPVTCSIGLGQLRGAPDSLELVLGRLEAALTAGKRGGKNRVALAEPG